jgi:hypothetical protein
VALHVLGVVTTVAAAAWLWSATAEPDLVTSAPPADAASAPALAGRT